MAHTYEPSLWPASTGVEKCTRTYGPYVQVHFSDTCTYGLYIWVSKMHPYICAIKTAHIYRPYVWVVRISFKLQTHSVAPSC